MVGFRTHFKSLHFHFISFHFHCPLFKVLYLSVTLSTFPWTPSAHRATPTTPSRQVRPPGIFCCRPDCLELAARLWPVASKLRWWCSTVLAADVWSTLVTCTLLYTPLMLVGDCDQPTTVTSSSHETRVRSTRFGCRSFHVCGPTIWNKLPQDLRSTDTREQFKRCLKSQELAIWVCVRQEARLIDID